MTRDELIAQARTYLRVRWRHQGQHRDGGVDCVGLLVALARDFGMTVQAPTNYHHHPSDALLLSTILDYCDEVPKDQRQAGDFLFFRNLSDGTWHMAIQTEHGMIHSAAIYRMVVEHRIADEWASRLSRVYRLKGLTDGR